MPVQYNKKKAYLTTGLSETAFRNRSISSLVQTPMLPESLFPIPPAALQGLVDKL